MKRIKEKSFGRVWNSTGLPLTDKCKVEVFFTNDNDYLFKIKRGRK